MAVPNSSSIFIAKSASSAVFPLSSCGMSGGSIDFEPRGYHANRMLSFYALNLFVCLVLLNQMILHPNYCPIYFEFQTQFQALKDSQHLLGWCGEIRDVIFSENGRVTVVYRVTIRGSDGEVWLLYCKIAMIIYLIIALLNLNSLMALD
ncbi:hypothetical protein GH714_027288 [Hevea brasiliensis]|uniref:Uncharacterized protein n=1 Tax=Hevea brasiliensis TaxID=3981 RepID=A0A6A6MHB9_HEVBR|nr:hypothetical protein GH714_027288 [Hevea brasiliensis]